MYWGKGSYLPTNSYLGPCHFTKLTPYIVNKRLSDFRTEWSLSVDYAKSDFRKSRLVDKKNYVKRIIKNRGYTTLTLFLRGGTTDRDE